MKTHRLEHWGLGQTKALWKYDALTYEKELIKNEIKNLEEKKESLDIGEDDAKKEINNKLVNLYKELGLKKIFTEKNNVSDTEIKEFTKDIDNGIDEFNEENEQMPEMTINDQIQSVIANDLTMVRSEDD